MFEKIQKQIVFGESIFLWLTEAVDLHSNILNLFFNAVRNTINIPVASIHLGDGRNCRG